MQARRARERCRLAQLLDSPLICDMCLSEFPPRIGIQLFWGLCWRCFEAMQTTSMVVKPALPGAARRTGNAAPCQTPAAMRLFVSTRAEPICTFYVKRQQQQQVRVVGQCGKKKGNTCTPAAGRTRAEEASARWERGKEA